MEASGHEGGRGLRRNAIGLPGLIAQSLGVTAPEISAVVIAAVVASRVGGFVPGAFWVAGIGAIGLALIYGRMARYVRAPAARTQSCVRVLAVTSASSAAGRCWPSGSSSSPAC